MPLLNSLRRLTTALPYPGLHPGLAEAKPSAEAWAVCENPACGRARPRRREREGRRFEGRWMCSEHCWSAMLRLRIERELFAREPAAAAPYAHRVPLGLLLLSMGLVSEDELQAALAAQRQAKKGRIGDWLRRRTKLTEQEITRALGAQWACPVFDLEAYSPRVGGIPRELAEAYRILPLPARGRGVLYLGFDSAPDAAAAYAVRHITGVRVEAGLAAESAFAQAWRQMLAVENRAAAVVSAQNGERLHEAASAILHAQDVADARLVRLHQHVWLRVFSAKEPAENGVNFRDYLYLLPHCGRAH